jgi:hypothetical protein
VYPQVLLARGDQLVDAAEHASADHLVGQFAEPPLDQVQPGAGGGGEVQVEAGMLGQPGFDLGFGVGAVVVHDQVDLQLARHLAVDDPQEPEELLVPVPGEALTDHVAGQHVQRGEQGGGAVALVVVGDRAGPAGFDRQAGLGAVQRLLIRGN